MHWSLGPQGRTGSSRLTRAQRHEPFSPRLPRFVRAHPGPGGGALALLGIAGNWAIARNMADWPAWMMFPSMLLSVLALAAMMIGLGVLVVRLLEPVLAMMEIDWGDEPLATLGIPPTLQRKCEQLGYWTAEDLVRAVDRGQFSWIALEYDERMQLERVIQRWRSAGVAPRKRSLWSRGRG